MAIRMTGPSKAEVWMIDLGGSRGHEQKKERPGIVWRDLDHVKMAIVIPLTSSLEDSKFPHTHFISRTTENGLSEDSISLVFQMRSLDKKRFINKIGELDLEDIYAIAAVMKDMLRV